MTIFFPMTNRVHEARQQLLLSLLAKDHEVVTHYFDSKKGDMSARAIDISKHFDKVIREVDPDLVLIRGDRFEMLPLAMIASYLGIPVAHIEGGDLTGVIDDKVRHAVTKLADVHFATNKGSFARLISMGADPDWTFNVGSLDVEYALSVETDNFSGEPYVVFSFHPFTEENGAQVKKISRGLNIRSVWISSNHDYGVQTEGEEYSPEQYMVLLKNAKCLVGNSSSFLKEASVFGTPVVNVGTRQGERLKPRNCISVPHNQDAIKVATDYQIRHGRYRPDYLYYKPDTSKQIWGILNDYENDRINHN